MGKTISRKSFIGVLAALVVCAALLFAATPQDAYASQGWNSNSKGHWYEYDAKGHYYKTGWQKIDNEWYYFQSNGYTKQGWIKSGGYWYFLTNPHYAPNNGPRMAHSACEYDNGKWYYFDKSGRMATKAGWLKYNFGWIYIDKSGVVASNCWKKIGGKWYYFGGDSYRGTSIEILTWAGFKMINGSIYYFDKNGALATGWQKYNGKWYLMNKSGVMQTGWQKYNGEWYYLYYLPDGVSGDGSMVTGWRQISGKWYYFAKSGAMQKSKWVGNYYVQSNGVMATNTWIGNYHVGADGKWDKTRSGYAKQGLVAASL